MISKELRISLSFALGHLIIGNLVGISDFDSAVYDIISVLFLPYSFIAGLSKFAGWDWLSLLLEIGGFIIMTIVFYPFSLFFIKEKKP